MLALSGRVKVLEKGGRTATHPAQGQGQPGDNTPGPTPYFLPLVRTVSPHPQTAPYQDGEDEETHSSPHGREIRIPMPGH